MAHLTSGHSAVEVSYILLSQFLKQEYDPFDPYLMNPVHVLGSYSSKECNFIGFFLFDPTTRRVYNLKFENSKDISKFIILN